MAKWVRHTGLAPGVREQMQVGEWMLAAGAQAMHHLMMLLICRHAAFDLAG